MVCESELWVERSIQDVKSSSKNRAHASPEPIIGKYFLLQQQELAMRAKWAGRFPVLLEPARERLPHGEHQASSWMSQLQLMPSHLT